MALLHREHIFSVNVSRALIYLLLMTKILIALMSCRDCDRPGSSDYSPYINHYALCISKAVKRTTELMFLVGALKMEPLLSLLSVQKLLGHLREETLAKVVLAGKSLPVLGS